MWGVSGFGVEPFGFVRVDVVGAVGPAPLPPIVAHLVGIEPAFALVGRETSFALVGREPAAISLNTLQVNRE